MFRNLLEKGNLLDLGWKRNKFTCCNHHEDESFTKERLDTAIANTRWRLNYSEASVETLPAICSDHSPILLSCSFERCSAYRYHTSFKYEANWNKEEGCSEIVSEAWQGAKRHWLIGGDKNTNFYHACVNHKRKKNTITRILDMEGTVMSEKEDIAAGFKSHYTAIYKSTQPNSVCIEQSLQGLEPRLIVEMK
ncbi:uncharacterized protein LOC122278474 [Carya illinoinensis]|uniref:uncharacterized protein LOC122278474 n=1 Tax=Carya illinoinensis TaxID=32201 RepID=UPI001C724DA3|nr:uncharacterized protein LOC122278474 [Carya illinoinensis]